MTQLRTFQPWAVGDGHALAQHIRRSYAQQLLDVLPFIPDDVVVPEDLRRGYCALTRQLERAVRLSHDPGLCESAASALLDAPATRAVWELVHRHLVAVELQALWRQPGEHDELELVLLAEQRVEQASATGADQGAGGAL